MEVGRGGKGFWTTGGGFSRYYVLQQHFHFASVSFISFCGGKGMVVEGVYCILYYCLACLLL